jgi:hypothetical protein
MTIAASKLWPGFPAPQVPADTSVDVADAWNTMTQNCIGVLDRCALGSSACAPVSM